MDAPKRTEPTPVHRHTTVTEHVLRQHRGIPYEVERTKCVACRAVLEEKALRRAAA